MTAYADHASLTCWHTFLDLTGRKALSFLSRLCNFELNKFSGCYKAVYPYLQWRYGTIGVQCIMSETMVSASGMGSRTWWKAHSRGFFSGRMYGAHRAFESQRKMVPMLHFMSPAERFNASAIWNSLQAADYLLPEYSRRNTGQARSVSIQERISGAALKDNVQLSDDVDLKDHICDCSSAIVQNNPDNLAQEEEVEIQSSCCVDYSSDAVEGKFENSDVPDHRNDSSSMTLEQNLDDVALTEISEVLPGTAVEQDHVVALEEVTEVCTVALAQRIEDVTLEGSVVYSPEGAEEANQIFIKEIYQACPAERIEEASEAKLDDCSTTAIQHEIDEEGSVMGKHLCVPDEPILQSNLTDERLPLVERLVILHLDMTSLLGDFFNWDLCLDLHGTLSRYDNASRREKAKSTSKRRKSISALRSTMFDLKRDILEKFPDSKDLQWIHSELRRRTT